MNDVKEKGKPEDYVSLRGSSIRGIYTDGSKSMSLKIDYEILELS
jgi:hypothetical protein